VIPSLHNPQALNRYSYCYNNPLKLTDPSGHWPWDSVKEFFQGVGDAVVNTAKGVAQMVVNPVETAKAVGYAVTHPVETFNAIKDSYVEKAGSIRGIGEICGEGLITIASLASGGAAIAKGVQAISRVAQGAKVVEEASVITQNIGWTGKIGENALKQLGGESQVYFNTSQGARYIDQLAGGIGYESKVGRTSLTTSIQKQISKDVELINTSRIQASVWYFYRSPVTGKIGPSPSLASTLVSSGIMWYLK
jgi:hypothetical protein